MAVKFADNMRESGDIIGLVHVDMIDAAGAVVMTLHPLARIAPFSFYRLIAPYWVFAVY